MSIASKIEQYTRELPSGVNLVAVSKYKPVEAIMEAYGAGQRRFGENRSQELALKAAALPKDIEWHFIGHLQTNKIKMVLPHVAMIHSIDSEKLIRQVNATAQQLGIKVKCLLEVHVAAETTKQGFTPEEAIALASRAGEFGSVELCGVMTMATNTDDMEQVRGEFTLAADTLKKVAEAAHIAQPQLSMGMSGDYRIAIECGSTYVRIGSDIFGERK